MLAHLLGQSSPNWYSPSWSVRRLPCASANTNLSRQARMISGTVWAHCTGAIGKDTSLTSVGGHHRPRGPVDQINQISSAEQAVILRRASHHHQAMRNVLATSCPFKQSNHTAADTGACVRRRQWQLATVPVLDAMTATAAYVEGVAFRPHKAIHRHTIFEGGGQLAGVKRIFRRPGRGRA